VTVTDSSCAVSAAKVVTCASPTEGQAVRFTLRPDKPAATTALTIRAQAAAGYDEQNAADNAATTSLTPDVVLSSVTVTGHRALDAQALVRAEITGVPAGLASVRIRLSGAGVGTGPTEVHLTDGPSGANAEGDVGCFTSTGNGSAATNGTYATCTGAASAVNGRFYVDLRIAHPHGTSTPVTFTVLAVGLDEGEHAANNTRGLTIG
jgi:hypothetical protein